MHGDALVRRPVPAVAVEGGQIMIPRQADGLAEDALVRLELEGAVGEGEEPQDNLKYRIGEHRMVAQHRRGVRKLVGTVAVGAFDWQRQIDRGVVQRLCGAGASLVQRTARSRARSCPAEAGVDQRQDQASLGQLLVGERRRADGQDANLGFAPHPPASAPALERGAPAAPGRRRSPAARSDHAYGRLAKMAESPCVAVQKSPALCGEPHAGTLY